MSNLANYGLMLLPVAPFVYSQPSANNGQVEIGGLPAANNKKEKTRAEAL